MLRFLHCLAVVIAVTSTLAGCLGEGKPAGDATDAPAAPVQTQATPGQLVARIEEMSKAPQIYGDTIDRHILTQQLAEVGPLALAPLIDYMAAPDTNPKARLFILQCVINYLTPAYIPSLKPMIESADEGTRAVGITAIGHIPDKMIVELLTAAKKDASPRVAFCALSGLAIQGDPGAREELRKMYLENVAPAPLTADQVKHEVVRVLLRDVHPEDLPVLLDALNQSFIEINARIMIAEALGRMGEKSAIPLLQQSLSLQKEPQYGEMVKHAITAINQRAGQA